MRKIRTKPKPPPQKRARQIASGSSTQRAATQRLSSRVPAFVASGAALVSIGSLGTAALLALNSKAGVWPLLALGAMLAGVALVSSIAFKTVERRGDQFLISDLLRRETVSTQHICMIVEARGMTTNVVRLHFSRATLFGWTVSFVPARTRQGFGGAVASSLRARAG